MISYVFISGGKNKNIYSLKEMKTKTKLYGQIGNYFSKNHLSCIVYLQ